MPNRLTIKNISGEPIITTSKGSILSNLQQNFIDLMHACGGKGRCTTCAIDVLKGAENLSPLTTLEEGFMVKERLLPHQRLACQSSLVEGDVCVSVPKKYQLPHITYT